MQALTRHLHNFLREVRLTEDEWNAAIGFLTAAGHITDEKRQEFVLLSDVLGASMRTIAINNQAYKGATEATVFGPFFIVAPEIPIGGDIAGGAHGEPCWVEGTVTDTDGNPVPGARIEVWEADEDGFYDVQYTDNRVAGRAHLFADENGQYAFWGLTPTPYPQGPTALALLDGRSDLAIYQISELMLLSHAKLVGPLPQTFQHYTEFSSVRASNTIKNPEVAALLHLLHGTVAKAAYSAAGLIPELPPVGTSL